MAHTRSNELRNTDEERKERLDGRSEFFDWRANKCVHFLCTTVYTTHIFNNEEKKK